MTAEETFEPSCACHFPLTVSRIKVTAAPDDPCAPTSELTVQAPCDIGRMSRAVGIDGVSVRDVFLTLCTPPRTGTPTSSENATAFTLLVGQRTGKTPHPSTEATADKSG